MSATTVRIRIRAASIIAILMLLCGIQLCFESADCKNAAAKHEVKQSAEDKAIDIVAKQKKVKEWLANFKGPDQTSKIGGHASFRVDGHKGDRYTVIVAEDLPDRLVTFNIYDVNIRTGKATSQF